MPSLSQMPSQERRGGIHVINGEANGANAAAGEALIESFRIDDEIENEIEGTIEIKEHFVEGLSLVEGAGKAIQDKTAGEGEDFVAHDLQHEIIRNEEAGVHELADFQAGGSTRALLGSEDIAAEARWVRPKESQILTAWVPLPDPGGPSKAILMRAALSDHPWRI